MSIIIIIVPILIVLIVLIVILLYIFRHRYQIDIKKRTIRFINNSTSTIRRNSGQIENAYNHEHTTMNDDSDENEDDDDEDDRRVQQHSKMNNVTQNGNASRKISKHVIDNKSKQQKLSSTQDKSEKKPDDAKSSDTSTSVTEPISSPTPSSSAIADTSGHIMPAGCNPNKRQSLADMRAQTTEESFGSMDGVINMGKKSRIDSQDEVDEDSVISNSIGDCSIDSADEKEDETSNKIKISKSIEKKNRHVSSSSASIKSDTNDADDERVDETKRYDETTSDDDDDDDNVPRKSSDQIRQENILSAMQREYEAEKAIQFDKTKMTWEVAEDDLTINYRSCLGRGDKSVVYLARLHSKAPATKMFSISVGGGDQQRHQDCEVAVKTRARSETNPTRQLLHEIEILKTIGYHENISLMLGCVTQHSLICLIMELAKHDLRVYLELLKNVCNPKNMPKKNFLSISQQIANAMVFLVSKKLIHRDIAARNVLIYTNLKAKLGDFNLCGPIDANNAVYLDKTKYTLSIKYMPPEALSDDKYSEKSDIWSFGVLLYEMYSLNTALYPQVKPESMLEHLVAGNRLPQPQYADEFLYSLMNSCWHISCDHRPAFNDLYKIIQNLIEKTENIPTTAPIETAKSDNDSS